MSRYLKLAVAIFLAAVLQSTAFPHLTFFGNRPDLILVISVLFTLVKEPFQGKIATFLAGFLQDLFSASVFGMNALCNLLAVFPLSNSESRFFYSDLPIQISLVGIISLAKGLLVFLFLYFFQQRDGFWMHLAGNIIPTACYNMALVVLISHPFIAWISGRSLYVKR